MSYITENLAGLYQDKEAFAAFVHCVEYYQEVELEARSKQNICFPAFHKI
jgi:hypothetical protein